MEDQYDIQPSRDGFHKLTENRVLLIRSCLLHASPLLFLFDAFSDDPTDHSSLP
jgi:hypothetical protein